MKVKLRNKMATCDAEAAAGLVSCFKPKKLPRGRQRTNADGGMKTKSRARRVCGRLSGGARRGKAICVRITLPETVRQERCCTSNYLIREAATLQAGGELG